MRIVVKIGSSSLTTKQQIDASKLQDHVDAVAFLKKLGHEVIIVSSGAVAAGFKRLGYPSRPVTIKGKQAAAAIGQSILIQHYSDLFTSHNLYVAQLLLTRDDFTQKKRYQNAHATLAELLERNIIPIINENDTVSIAELTFGDNDMLSALVAAHMHADFLMILTDINGLYTDNPNTNKAAIRINFVEDISDQLLTMASDTSSSVGTGGMTSKLTAAKYAIENGVHTFIGTGYGQEKLYDIMNYAGDGTYFKKKVEYNRSIKRWLTLTESNGTIFIDAGANEAIVNGGKSLLVTGITHCTGHFEQGDVVDVCYHDQIVGRGEIECSFYELTELINDTNKKRSKVIIHRDAWVKL